MRRSALFLLGTLVLAAPIVVGVWIVLGEGPMQAALLAAALCAVGGVAALCVPGIVGIARTAPLAEMLLAMMIRFGFALAAAVGIFALGGPLLKNGVLYYLVIFYVLTLWLEVGLMIPKGQTAQGRNSDEDRPTATDMEEDGEEKQ